MSETPRVRDKIRTLLTAHAPAESKPVPTAEEVAAARHRLRLPLGMLRPTAARDFATILRASEALPNEDRSENA